MHATHIPLLLVLHLADTHIIDSSHNWTHSSELIDSFSSEEVSNINPWIGGKIGSEHVLNDLGRDDLENEIPQRIEENAHPCRRKCVDGDNPMTCKYHFKVEWYQTMSTACFDCPFNSSDCRKFHCIHGDGVKRAILTVNRQMPGPAIEICVNDRVVVEVENSLLEEGTSVHWHGQLQRKSPYMDGVPFLTQCPIPARSTFLYNFTADNPGTHFWHSHSALQRGDGMFGAFIVKVPESQDPHREFYDFDLPEHVMIIWDWTHSASIHKFINHYHSTGDNKGDSILVNGKGRYVEFEDENGRIYTTPMEQFTVREGFRYRFRIINSGFLNCPIELSIDNHTIVVVSSDGYDVEPEEAESLVTYAGERFDVIVQMDQPIGNYWIRYRGLMDCDERFTSAFQTAILHYEGAPENSSPEGEKPTYENSAPGGLQINSLNVGFQWNGSMSIPEMSAIASMNDQRLKLEPDFKFFVGYDFFPLNNPLMYRKGHYEFKQITIERDKRFTPQLNHISMKPPPFPLLLDLKDANRLQFCNESSIAGQHCEQDFCECTHLLRVPLNAVVEMILVDQGVAFDANHPFHLHGHSFRVIGMDRIAHDVTMEQIKQLDADGKLRRNFHLPLIKDTVTVPDGGYTIIRWQANNPGYWLFHCHIDFHVELGMAIIFKVGDDEQFAPIPKRFPRCSNHVFGTQTEDDDTIDQPKPNRTRMGRYKNYNSSHVNEVEFERDIQLQRFVGNTTSYVMSHVTSSVILITSVLLLMVCS